MTPERSPRAALVAVGTELVADGRPDTNGSTISRILASIGIETAWRVSVNDDEDLIAGAVLDAVKRFALVIVTGGLGPTVDDVTREAVARAFNLPLDQDPRLLETIREIHLGRGRPFSKWSARQAMVPRGAVILPNDAGTAPGLLLTTQTGARVALLPGVPHEMERMMESQLLPRLSAVSGAFTGDRIATRGLKASGLTEIEVQERVLDLFPPDEREGPALTLLASPGEVTLIVRGRDVARLDRILAQARERLGDHLFADDLAVGLETAVGRSLLSRGLSLATAESCTGGMLGSLITRVPGSSRWYLQGWVTYSDEAKVSQLGVQQALLERYGAVSAEVADAMAAGARLRSGADLAASITGIAGPEGGTPDKPVGLVYISLASGPGARATRHLFAGDRETIRLFAARIALNRIRSEAA